MLISKGLISWDRYEVRPAWLEIAPHTNPRSCLRETGSNITSDRSHSFRVVDRHEWVQTGLNWSGTKLSSWKREISADQPLIRQRTRKTLLLGTNARNANWNFCKDVSLVSLRPHVNTSENFHFGSGLNSCLSHVISSLDSPFPTYCPLEPKTKAASGII